MTGCAGKSNVRLHGIEEQLAVFRIADGHRQREPFFRFFTVVVGHLAAMLGFVSALDICTVFEAALEGQGLVGNSGPVKEFECFIGLPFQNVAEMRQLGGVFSLVFQDRVEIAGRGFILRRARDNHSSQQRESHDCRQRQP